MLDVYLSVESQVFLVNYNHSTGYNHVHFDTKYPINRDKQTGKYKYTGDTQVGEYNYTGDKQIVEYNYTTTTMFTSTQSIPSTGINRQVNTTKQ